MCESFGKSYFQSNGTAFQQAVMIRFSQVGREIETKQSVPTDVIFSRHVDIFVLECFSRAGEHAYISFCDHVVVEVARDGFHGLVLRVDLESELRDFVIFEVEMIFRIEAVERIVIDASDYYSKGQLPLENVFLIHRQTVSEHGKRFAFHSVERILGVRKLQSFGMCQRHGGRDSNFSGAQHGFGYADFEGRIASTGKQNERILVAH